MSMLINKISNYRYYKEKRRIKKIIKSGKLHNLNGTEWFVAKSERNK